MGCSESMNSLIKLTVELNTPVFKTSLVKQSSTIRTHLRDFCKQVISSNLNSEFQNSNISFKITCKGNSYSIKDCVPIYDLRLTEDDVISISGTILEPKNIELTLRIFYEVPKEITLKVSKTSRIESLLDRDPSLRFIRGDIQLELSHKIEDYDIMNKSKLYILVDNVRCEEVQIWKIKKSGLVLEAGCLNNECVAYRQRISINIGIGTFEVNSEISQENERVCVSCKHHLGKVTKIGFCHCKYSCSVTAADGTKKELSGSTKDYVEGYMPVGEELVIVTTEELY